MWLSMAVRYYLKGRPDHYRGITQENITYCKEKGAPFSKLMSLVFREVVEWYMRFVEPDELNAELDAFRQIIADVKIVEE